MAAEAFEVGDSAYLRARFRQKVSGVPTLYNPATVSLKIKAPDGTISTVTPSMVYTGAYRYLYTFAQAGRYETRWETTGGAGHQTEIIEVAPNGW